MENGTKINRDDRQYLSVTKWKEAKGIGTIVACTGYGKTRCATMIIDKAFKKLKVCIIVPTLYLKDQWESKVGANCEVIVINTAIKEKKHYDLLVLDEIHRYGSNRFSNVFTKITYTYILGLTATYERADGKDELLSKYAPVIDEVTLEEARANGWVANYKKYDILIPVKLGEYKRINSKYHKFFAFFGHDFKVAMACATSDSECKMFAWKMGWEYKDVKLAALNFMRYMQKRRTWINNHPSKIEVANQIIAARAGKKIITFSAYNKQADLLAKHSGISYHTGKTSGNIQDFIDGTVDVVHTSSKLDEGADIPNLEVGIVTSGGSKRQSIQRLGRVIRKEDNKVAEFFNLVLEGTQDLKWLQKRSEEDINLIKLKNLNELLTNTENIELEM